jgi:hypothetical protein
MAQKAHEIYGKAFLNHFTNKNLSFLKAAHDRTNCRHFD